MNITLIGYRATGKTTLARLLAERLRWDPQAERFAGDEAANRLLRARPIRGPWKLSPT